jgi:4-alpha-glucanotransferase
LKIYASGGAVIVLVVEISKKRVAGIMIPVFSTRREGDLGIGDTLGLKDWIDWAAQYEVGILQLLPIHENGTEESPYSGISATALDPIYLACEVTEIPGLTQEAISAARESLKDVLDAPLVDYPAVRAAKRGLLEVAWSRFSTLAAELWEEFEVFKQVEADWLTDYTLFRFLMEHHGEEKTWDQWPKSCRTHKQARAYMEKLRVKHGEALQERLDYFAFVQWICFRQWLEVRAYANAKGVKLMGDVPIGVSFHSCDVFFGPEEFHLDWCGGSPPEGMGQSDPFFQQWGQNWGIPLYQWDRMDADGYGWWRRRIERLTRIFQVFRLDHILGFYRIYAFPWRPERNHEFLGLSHEAAALLTGGRLPRWDARPDDYPENKAANCADGDQRLKAILKAAAGAEVIAEDLGWVPEYVRPHLEKLGIAGFRIPHWDCNEQGHPTPGSLFPENTFATYSTHDHDPVNGIWRGCLGAIERHAKHPADHTYGSAKGAESTLRILSEFSGIPLPKEGAGWPEYSEGIQLRLVKALLSSNSRYAVLMVTELFDLNERINHPGTSGGINWRYRLPWTVAQIQSDPRLRGCGEKLAALISITRRC